MTYDSQIFTHKGLTVRLIPDDDAMPPEQDKDLFIATILNRQFEFVTPLKDVPQYEDFPRDFRAQYWSFPVYASGRELRLEPCPWWNKGHIGFVFAAKQQWKFRSRDRKRRVSAKTAAANLIERWNQFLNGDVWGVVIEKPAVALDSCWVFYGKDYALEEGKRMASDCAYSLNGLADVGQASANKP